MTARAKAWFGGSSRRLLTLDDTPSAIAGGVAIGMFFGFTPLFGLKTLLSLLVAWLCGCNLIAATIAVTLHDVALPFLPLLYRWEYDLGFWLLNQPHRWPEPLSHTHLGPHGWRSWTTFLTVGKPLLLGSLLVATPVAVVTFYTARQLVVRHRRQHPPPATPPAPPAQ